MRSAAFFGAHDRTSVGASTYFPRHPMSGLRRNARDYENQHCGNAFRPPLCLRMWAPGSRTRRTLGRGRLSAEPAWATLVSSSYSTGQFEEAVNCFQRAIVTLPSSGDSRSALIDTLARIRLAQGQTKESAALLDEIEAGIRRPEIGSSTLIATPPSTHAHLMARQGRFQDALDQADRTLALADEAKDHLLVAPCAAHESATPSAGRPSV